MRRKEEESISRFINASVSKGGRARISLVCIFISQHPDAHAYPTRSMRNDAEDPHENTTFREITEEATATAASGPTFSWKGWTQLCVIFRLSGSGSAIGWKHFTFPHPLAPAPSAELWSVESIQFVCLKKYGTRRRVGYCRCDSGGTSVGSMSGGNGQPGNHLQSQRLLSLPATVH